jgi:thiosulfate dehydrogenase
MEALIAYMGWISHEVMDSPTLPWLGLDDIDSKHKPDAKKGEHVYDNKCAICHGATGAGNIKIPPLWGDMSYNDGAGMNTLKMLSSFVWQNMPYGQPTLTQDEALDVAAFLITKPRPHFVP